MSFLGGKEPVLSQGLKAPDLPWTGLLLDVLGRGLRLSGKTVLIAALASITYFRMADFHRGDGAVSDRLAAVPTGHRAPRILRRKVYLHGQAGRSESDFMDLKDLEPSSVVEVEEGIWRDSAFMEKFQRFTDGVIDVNDRQGLEIVLWSGPIEASEQSPGDAK